jgi:hypothetical protein
VKCAVSAQSRITAHITAHIFRRHFHLAITPQSHGHSALLQRGKPDAANRAGMVSFLDRWV